MEEKNTFKANMIGVYKRLFPFISPYIPRLLVGLLCGVLHGGSTFGMIVVLRFALGGLSGEIFEPESGFSMLSAPDGSAGDLEFQRIVWGLLLLPAVAIVQGIMLFAGRYYVEWAGSRVITDLRQALFSHMHALPMHFFSKSRVGELMTRITSDTGLLLSLVTNVIGDLMRDPFTMIGCIAAMFYLDWRLSLIILLVFPLCLLPISVLGKRIRIASKSGQEQTADMLSSAQESLSGALVVKAFQQEGREVERFGHSNLQAFKMGMRQLRARAISEPIIYFMISIGLAGVLVYSYKNNISLALLVSFFVATVQMYKPFKKLSQIHLRFQTAAPGVERVFEILDQEVLVDDRPQAITLDAPIQSIKFDQVGFAYDEKRVLQDINVEIQAGQCMAFVGGSGAGKTTLVNMVPRFFDPNQGALRINGVDLRDYTLMSLREQVGVVTQDTVLFNRSVADNIAYGVPSATREDIIDAAKRANADGFIQEMEHGYDTLIGERGAMLSGGMAQRITIARALLKNPPILILDEATSALDTESERLVQEALNELMKNRTVLVIAHRLSTITNADHIVVLDQGRIVEQGTHHQLLALEGKYRYLHDLQFQNESTTENEV